jgi:hypothetical protein
MTTPLPPLANKRRPRRPYHTTISPNPSPRHFHCIESMKLLLLCLLVLSRLWVPVPSLIPDDLATKIIQISLVDVPLCTQQNIQKMQQEESRSNQIWSLMDAAPCLHVFYAHDCIFNSTSSLLWELLNAPTTLECVPWCVNYICMSIHWVWSWCHEEHNRLANCRSTTMPSCTPEIIR